MKSGIPSGVIIKKIGWEREPMRKAKNRRSGSELVQLSLPPLISATRLRPAYSAYSIPGCVRFPVWVLLTARPIV